MPEAYELHNRAVSYITIILSVAAYRINANHNHL